MFEIDGDAGRTEGMAAELSGDAPPPPRFSRAMTRRVGRRWRPLGLGTPLETEELRAKARETDPAVLPFPPPRRC